MKHQQVIKQLSLFIDGELAENESRALQQHLDSCESCQHALQRMKNLRHFVTAESNFQPNPFLTTRVMAAAQQRQNNGFLGMFDFIPKPVMNLSIILTLILFSIITFAPFAEETTIDSAEYPIVSSSMEPSVETYDEALEFAYLNEYFGDL